jgi:DNA replication initiation complex subunit (GINS family)
MALFGDSVPREFYEDMRQQRDRLAQELSHALKVEDPENPEFDADLAQRIYDGDPG